jgi:hypothetical protein
LKKGNFSLRDSNPSLTKRGRRDFSTELYGEFLVQNARPKETHMNLLAEIIPISEIGSDQRAGMFALMEQYYAGMSRDIFETDLSEKHWVVQLLDAQTREIRGFSTQMVLELTVGGRPVRALFSGDTIVDRSCWGQSALAQAWGQLALTLIAENPATQLFWFLISKGYKTYRYLPVFFREFYPRLDTATPGWAMELIDTLASYKYPASYDPEAGIIRASDCRLRKGIAEITPERLRDPHIRFFAERNPGHIRGDELCCIAPLSRGNFTAAACRQLRARRLERIITQ